MRQTRKRCRTRSMKRRTNNNTKRSVKRRTNKKTKRSMKRSRGRKNKVILSTKNLNEMSKKELLSIGGIGRKLTCRIIEKRPFNTLEDLYTIEGFGDTAYTCLKKHGIFAEDNTPLDLTFNVSPESPSEDISTINLEENRQESSVDCDVNNLIGAIKELTNENKNLQDKIKECQESRSFQVLTSQESGENLGLSNNPKRCMETSLDILKSILNL